MGQYLCYRNNELPENAKPSENAIEFGCDACEYMENNELKTCSKFIGITGKSPQSNEEYIETFKCSENWMPILMIENSQKVLSTAAATESLRNVTAESFSAMNANLKNTAEALVNTNMMKNLKQDVRDVTPVVTPAVTSAAGAHQVAISAIPKDIYGG